MSINNSDDLIKMLDSLVEKGVGEIKVTTDQSVNQGSCLNECRPGSACYTPTLMEGLDRQLEE
mgnify:CR=1 FL=1